MLEKYRRILIVGPCSTGKSTLARLISQKMLLPYFCLDDLFIDFDSITPTHRDFYSKEVIENNIKEILKHSSWVAEGPYVIKPFFEKCDVIVFTSRSLLTALLWQWKRFFTDPLQIHRWGLGNNLLLSKLIIHQYLDKNHFYKFQGVNYPTLVYFNEQCNKYRPKVFVLNDKVDYHNLYKHFSLLQ